ncbi:MAG TPA: alcohol dehydrogenase catalytic domain-containing protein [Acidothermaceae bacterium]|jgi:2-desacetyl-2-hydroxyethyl bacteriochlorophyllide A dehydrogenase
MRAARYTGPKTIETADVVVGEPAAGEVQLAVAYTGICGTDLHIYHGDMDARVRRPAVIGHECSATIAAVGDGVEGWSVGDSVTVLPVRSCGSCAACQAGFGHVCPQLVFLGIDATGAMQNRWNVPAQLLVRLPTEVNLRHAALVEPTAVAVHDVRRAGLARGQHVVVVGGGPVGTLIAVVARAAGADVSLVEVDGERRALAAKLGFRVIDPTSSDVTKEVFELTSSRGADVAFEVSGSAGGVATAVDVLGVRGKLVMVAIHTQPREVNLHRFFWRELEMVGARLYERRDFEEAAALIASGVVPAEELISAVVPLDAAGEAFASLAHGGVMKVLVDCTEAGKGTDDV